MVNEVEIKTNLSRKIILSAIFMIGMTIFYLMSRNIGSLLTLLLALGIIAQYFFSKKLARILVDNINKKITFEFFRFTKKVIVFDRNIIKVGKRKEVHFRGGANEVFEVYSMDKKIFEISQRSFKTEDDYRKFLNCFFADRH